MYTHYYVVDNDFNRTNYPHLIGKSYYPQAPSYAAVEEVTVTMQYGEKIRTWGGWYKIDRIIVNGTDAGYIQTKRQNKRTTVHTGVGAYGVMGANVSWVVSNFMAKKEN